MHELSFPTFTGFVNGREQEMLWSNLLRQSLHLMSRKREQTWNSNCDFFYFHFFEVVLLVHQNMKMIPLWTGRKELEFQTKKLETFHSSLQHLFFPQKERLRTNYWAQTFSFPQLSSCLLFLSFICVWEMKLSSHFPGPSIPSQCHSPWAFAPLPSFGGAGFCTDIHYSRIQSWNS